MLLDLEKPRRRNAISLTPLIDVVFILLLFFMLTSQFIQQRRVDLPVPTAGTADDAEVLNIQLAANGRTISVEDETLDVDDLSALKQLVAAHGKEVFALDVEKGATTQAFITLVDRLKQAGAKQVSMAGVLP